MKTFFKGLLNILIFILFMIPMSMTAIISIVQKCGGCDDKETIFWKADSMLQDLLFK